VKRKRNGRQVGLPSPAALSPVVLCLSPVGIYYTRRKKPRKKKKKHPPTLPLFFLPVLLHLPQFLSFWMFWLGSPRKRFFQLRHLLLLQPSSRASPRGETLVCVYSFFILTFFFFFSFIPLPFVFIFEPRWRSVYLPGQGHPQSLCR
jgi:hypothetical protein